MLMVSPLNLLHSAGKPVDWHTMHVDTLTSLLKLWFREMPEPVFTFDMYQPFVDAQRMRTLANL